MKIEFNYICKICNEKLNKNWRYHVTNIHSISPENYILQYYFNNTTPICQCGCNTPVSYKIYNNFIHVSDYAFNHMPKKKHTPETIDKIKINTKLAIQNKYGTDNVFKLKEFQDKANQTKLSKYGDIKYNNAKKNKQTQLDNFHKNINNRLNNEYKLLSDIYEGVDKKYIFKHISCGHTFEDNINDGKYPVCRNCYPLVNKYSNLHKEIVDYINSIYDGILLINNRSVFKGELELDIYIPELNTAIEINGLYWHSELHGKDKKYHLNKTLKCYEKNIFLMQIFEDEWIFKKHIIKNKLKILFNKVSNKIHARKCIIKEIAYSEKSKFLELYHLQGNDTSFINVGAFYNNELISVLTLSKHRLSLGKKEHSINSIELSRFAIINDAIVNGIFSKMLSYVINKYNFIDEIISYADSRFVNKNSNVYIKNNFVYISTSSPNYWYTSNYKIREHRFKYRKHNLKKLLPNFDEKLTEWQNMINNKYDRIWDCGNYKYVLQIKKPRN